MGFCERDYGWLLSAVYAFEVSMILEDNRYHVFSRRAFLLGTAKLGLFGVLYGQLYRLQAHEAVKYREIAEENRVNGQLISPLRGRIVDRHGKILAQNEQQYRLMLLPEKIEKFEETIDLLSQHFAIGVKEKKALLRQASRNPKFVPLVFKKKVTWQDVSKAEFLTAEISGLVSEEGMFRTYPYGPVLAHILGYVSPVSEAEIKAKKNDPVLKLPDAQSGKLGIEENKDDDLRGDPGERQVEINAAGRIIREISLKLPAEGKTQILSIDLQLQQFAYERMGLETGAAVVLDVRTGEVLLQVSTPSYDPNVFTSGVDHATWQQLAQNPDKPLINKPIAGLYPPASTFKTLTALALLHYGIAKPNQTVFCPGHYFFGNRQVHCWKKEGHGSVNWHDAIVKSCDVYFYEMTRRMGIQNLADFARLVGLGNKTNIELSGEKAGIVPDPAWKKMAKNQVWFPGETIIAGIGQGYLLTTPLQLAVMTARLATGANVHPTLFHQDHPKAFDPLGIHPDHLKLVREAMSDVVNVPGGTAYAQRLVDVGFTYAGKTGTAQVRRISMAQRAAGIYLGNIGITACSLPLPPWIIPNTPVLSLLSMAAADPARLPL
jgi:penicillin-binding protein 2